MYNEEKIFKSMMSRIKSSSRKTVIRENGSYSRGRKEELEVKITWEDIRQKYHQQNTLILRKESTFFNYNHSDTDFSR